MKTIISKNTNPYFNLAWEEYIFKHVKCEEDILLLWQNEPSVILGRNQTVYGEVNVKYCKDNHIPIIRRISGGGTVYHDLGNLNYSIITNNYKDVISNYQHFTKPLVEFLNTIGIHAQFSGNSDIKINNMKISGNAQLYHQGRMLHHGTLLFDTNLTILNQVIKPITRDIDTQSVPSNRTQVTNISNHLKDKYTINTFMNKLRDFWLKDEYTRHIIELKDQDYKAIELLKQTKYMQWDWNYGESPRFQVKKTIDAVTVSLIIETGLITEFKLINQTHEINLAMFNQIKYDQHDFDVVLQNLDDAIKVLIEPFKQVLFE